MGTGLHSARLHSREEVEALPGGAPALESKVASLESLAGPLAPGATPGRRFMAHLREPLKVSYWWAGRRVGGGGRRLAGWLAQAAIAAHSTCRTV